MEDNKKYELFDKLNVTKSELTRLSEEQVDQIINYIGSGNNYEKNAFAEEAIKALVDDGEVDFAYKVIVDPSFKNNNCLNNVYNAMGKAPTFNNYLQNFDGEMSVANLKLTIGVHSSFISFTPGGCKELFKLSVKSSD